MEYSIKLKNGLVLRGFISSSGIRTRANIIFVHGHGEHIQRYSAWAELLNKESIGFTGVDLPGHGRSNGPRGYIKSYALTDEMIDILHESSVKTFPGIPVFIYGHSMGGGIVLDYLIRKKPAIIGAIVTSPLLKLAFEPSKSKQMLISLMKYLLPGFTQSSGLQVDHISHDRGEVEKYKNDPLIHDKISVSLFHNIMNAAAFSLDHAAELQVPLLLIHGSDDRICSPEGSRMIASKAPKAELKIWEGGYHELQNEPFRLDVFAYLMKWINKILGS